MDPETNLEELLATITTSNICSVDVETKGTEKITTIRLRTSRDVDDGDNRSRFDDNNNNNDDEIDKNERVTNREKSPVRADALEERLDIDSDETRDYRIPSIDFEKEPIDSISPISRRDSSPKIKTEFVDGAEFGNLLASPSSSRSSVDKNPKVEIIHADLDKSDVAKDRVPSGNTSLVSDDASHHHLTISSLAPSLTLDALTRHFSRFGAIAAAKMTTSTTRGGDDDVTRMNGGVVDQRCLVTFAQRDSVAAVSSFRRPHVVEGIRVTVTINASTADAANAATDASVTKATANDARPHGASSASKRSPPLNENKSIFLKFPLNSHSWVITENSLGVYFSRFGAVLSTRVPVPRENRYSWRCAYVNFYHAAAASGAWGTHFVDGVRIVAQASTTGPPPPVARWNRDRNFRNVNDGAGRGAAIVSNERYAPAPRVHSLGQNYAQGVAGGPERSQKSRRVVPYRR